MLKDLLLSLALLILCAPAFAQVDAKVYYNDKEVSDPRDTLKPIARKKADTILDSLRSKKLVTHSVPSEETLKHKLTDSLTAAGTPVQEHMHHADSAISALHSKGQDMENFKTQYQQVYSEKMIQQYLDSIGVDKIPTLPLKKEVAREEFVQMLNDKFVPDVAHAQDSLQGQVGSLDDLSAYKLPSQDLQELAPLTGQVVNSKYLQKLDSIRKVNLDEQRIRLQEKGVSEVSKVTSLDEKPTFWDKTYFEGILGLGDPNQFLVHFTPALGYHFTNYSSLGLGPVIQVAENDKGKKLATIGFRPFFKQEFWQRRVYLQAEYMWKPTGKDIEKTTVTSGSFLGGGGFLLPVSGVIALNVSVMYQMNRDLRTGAGASPWVVRIGISSIKSKK